MDAELLGKKIRQAREHAGLSQEQLGEVLGLGQRSMSEIENGKRRLAVAELPILAEALQVPILYFFTDVPSTSSALDEVLLDLFHQLPSDDIRHLVLEMIQLLVKHLY